MNWMTQGGARIGNGTLVNVTVSRSSSSSVTLTFDPLYSSHGDQYLCVAGVNISDANVYISGSGSYNITVQSEFIIIITSVTWPCPPPPLVPTSTLLITGSPVDEGFHTGLHITLTGRAEFNTSVDTPLIVWTKTNPSSNLISDTRVTISAPVQVQDTPNMVYETTLTINTLDRDRGDSGDYNLSRDYQQCTTIYTRHHCHHHKEHRSIGWVRRWEYISCPG